MLHAIILQNPHAIQLSQAHWAELKIKEARFVHQVDEFITCGIYTIWNSSKLIKRQAPKIQHQSRFNFEKSIFWVTLGEWRTDRIF